MSLPLDLATHWWDELVSMSGSGNISIRVATGILMCLSVAGAFAASARTQHADIQSTLSQHAARTTTISEPFKYDLKHPGGLTFLYNGCRGSRMEPCGCRALNLGGIGREVAMIQTIRRENPKAFYMDAGGFFREFTDPSMRLQSWHMLDALSHIDCQVINIGFPDLRQGMAALKYFEDRFKLPFVSANIVDAKSGDPVFASHKSFDVTLANGDHVKVAVVGVTAKSRDTSRSGAERGADAESDELSESTNSRGRWMIAETNGRIPWLPFDVHDAPAHAAGQGGASPAPASGGSLSDALKFAINGADGVTSESFAPYRLDDPWEAAQKMGKQLRADHDYLILLAYASHKVAVAMAPKLTDYDLVIAADYVGRRVQPVKPLPDGPLIIGGDHDGKYLGIVEVPMKTGAAADADLLPILQSIKPLPEYKKYIDHFTRDTEFLPVEEASGEIAEKIYAGVTSCRACHIDAYKQWKTHKHSHAMKTLVDKNMHFNPDCLRCHTVAYRMPGGFTDVRVTSYLSNVQCEVCHGPGEAHVQEMRAAEALQRQGKTPPPVENDMRMTWNAKFCMQCHDPQNDPRFNFPADIQRVRHKNPAPQRERPTTVSLEM